MYKAESREVNHCRRKKGLILQLIDKTEEGPTIDRGDRPAERGYHLPSLHVLGALEGSTGLVPPRELLRSISCKEDGSIPCKWILLTQHPSCSTAVIGSIPFNKITKYRERRKIG